MRKLKFKNVKGLTQGYSANIAHRWDSSSGWMIITLQMFTLEVKE